MQAEPVLLRVDGHRPPSELVGRPQNPDFLLKPNELLQTLMPELLPVAFEQGYNEAEHAVLQRICAVHPSASALLTRPRRGGA